MVFWLSSMERTIVCFQWRECSAMSASACSTVLFGGVGTADLLEPSRHRAWRRGAFGARASAKVPMRCFRRHACGMCNPIATGNRVVHRASEAHRTAERSEQLHRWLHFELGGGFLSHPVPSGASSRIFFRLQFADGRRSLIVRDARAVGDAERFVRVARLLNKAGVHAPVIIAHHLARGFVVMSDMGDTTYLCPQSRQR